MHLFRSEEHARRWEEYSPATGHLLQPVAWWAETFSLPLFRQRGRADYISWLSGSEGAATFAALRERLAPPRPDVAATTAAAASLAKVDISLLDGAAPGDRSVEERLMTQWPAEVPVEVARHWRDAARGMIVAIPASPLPEVDPAVWTDTRRSALRDAQTATGWLARADLRVGDGWITDRLARMGWQGNVADQPAWTAMEQSARAILKCQALAALAD